MPERVRAGKRRRGSGSRAYVGPVSSFHSVLTENFDRQADSDWSAEFEGGATPPRPSWTASFVR